MSDIRHYVELVHLVHDQFEQLEYERDTSWVKDLENIGEAVKQYYTVVLNEDLPEVSVDSQDGSMMVWAGLERGWLRFHKTESSAIVRDEALARLAVSEKLRQREEAALAEQGQPPVVDLDVSDQALKNLVADGWIPPKLRGARWAERVLDAASESSAVPERAATAAEEDAYDVASADWDAAAPAKVVENGWCSQPWDHQPHYWSKVPLFHGEPEFNLHCDGKVPVPERNILSLDNPPVPGPIVRTPRAKREGDLGTWSHCGNLRSHGPHTHSVIFNEGPYPDVHCNGTP